MFDRICKLHVQYQYESTLKIFTEFKNHGLAGTMCIILFCVTYFMWKPKMVFGSSLEWKSNWPVLGTFNARFWPEGLTQQKAGVQWKQGHLGSTAKVHSGPRMNKFPKRIEIAAIYGDETNQDVKFCFVIFQVTRLCQ